MVLILGGLCLRQYSDTYLTLLVEEKLVRVPWGSAVVFSYQPVLLYFTCLCIVSEAADVRVAGRTGRGLPGSHGELLGEVAGGLREDPEDRGK